MFSYYTEILTCGGVAFRDNFGKSNIPGQSRLKRFSGPFRDTGKKSGTSWQLRSNYQEDTVTLSSCTPFVTGYGDIFRRSHSSYIKSVEELGYWRQQELAVMQFVCGNGVSQ